MCMKKITPMDALQKKREAAFKKLGSIVRSRNFPPGTMTRKFVEVGLSLNLTSQTVSNYVNGRGGDGYMIEALIEEFSKIPVNTSN